MKNVGLMIPNLHSGGSERIVSRLSIELNKNYKVFLILFDANSLYYDFGGELIDLNLPPAKMLFNKLITMIKRIFKVRKIIKQNKIDIILSFTSAANKVNAFSFSNCKKIVSCRGFNHLQKHIKLYKKFYNLTDGILFNSKTMKEFYTNKYPKDFNKTYVLYNLFDNKKISEMSLETLNKTESEFFEKHQVISTVSRFCYEKGQWNLLKAFEVLKEKVPDAGLVFVGHDGEYEDKIKDMAKRSKYSEDVLFVGFQKNPFKYIANSSVYALCSLAEGFPNSLIEAMICKTPVVATNCKTGPSEILFSEYKRDFKCEKITFADFGILTPSFNHIIDFDLEHLNHEHFEYSKALELLLKNKLLNNFYIKALQFTEKFDKAAIINDYEEFINNLITKE